LTALPWTALSGGFLPRMAIPDLDVTTWFACSWLRWRRDLRDLLTESGPVSGNAPSNARDAAVIKVWRTVANRREIDADTLTRGFLHGLAAAGVSLDLDYPTRRSMVASTWRQLAESEADVFRWAFLGRDGRYKIGYRQVRDRARKLARRGLLRDHRLRDEAWFENEGMGARPTEIRQYTERTSTPTGEGAPEQADGHEAVAAFHAVVAAKLARVKRCSIERLLLEHSEPLFTGETSPTRLAREAGHSGAQARAVWRRLQSDIKHDLGAA
jgi:hypothetical protein